MCSPFSIPGLPSVFLPPRAWMGCSCASPVAWLAVAVRWEALLLLLLLLLLRTPAWPPSSSRGLDLAPIFKWFGIFAVGPEVGPGRIFNRGPGQVPQEQAPMKCLGRDWGVTEMRDWAVIGRDWGVTLDSQRCLPKRRRVPGQTPPPRPFPNARPASDLPDRVGRGPPAGHRHHPRRRLLPRSSGGVLSGDPLHGIPSHTYFMVHFLLPCVRFRCSGK